MKFTLLLISRISDYLSILNKNSFCSSNANLISELKWTGSWNLVINTGNIIAAEARSWFRYFNNIYIVFVKVLYAGSSYVDKIVFYR